MDALALLKTDHESVLAMFVELERGPTAATGMTAADLAARKDKVTEMVMAESAHEAVEEQYFWPTVRERVPEGDALADHAVGQEDDAKQVLQQLEKTAPQDPGFEGLLTGFLTDGREHIRYEETEVWPKVRATLSEAELATLGEKIAKAKKLAPTRPHPRTPPDPGVLKTAGVGAAMLDKARDAATGRGDAGH